MHANNVAMKLNLKESDMVEAVPVEPLNVEHFYGLLILFGIGLVSASLAFIAERFAFKRRKTVCDYNTIEMKPLRKKSERLTLECSQS